MSTETNVIEQVIEIQKRREAEALQVYRQIVRDIAAGGKRTPTPEQIDAAAAACRKTHLDLKADLERQIQRNQDRALIVDESEYVSKRAEFTSKIKAANEAFEKAKKTHEKAIHPLRWQREALDDQHAKSEQAIRRLQSDLTPDQEEEKAELENAVRVASTTKTAAVKHHRQMEELLVSEKSSNPQDTARHKQVAGYIENAEAKLADAEEATQQAIEAQDAFLARLLDA
ncbi:hypothetical protein [Rhodopirellula bahusiensis]|uniref:hypothetical protein n=1 Tax=Rhodopirellula bahusiensis TaxID=2014065 RepID=UPI003267D4F2